MPAQIKKILFITLSNIGDVILTLPVLDALRADFPQAQVTVMSGPRPKELFEDNPFISRLIVYDKHAGLGEKIRLFNELKREGFDLVVDLRNSFFGAFLPAKVRTPPFLRPPQALRHMKHRHLFKIQCLGLRTRGLPQRSISIRPKDQEGISQALKAGGISPKDKLVVVSPGARSSTKRWSAEKFTQLIERLGAECGVKVVLAGDKEDVPVCSAIRRQAKNPVLDLCAKTSIAELAALLSSAACVVTNDSAVLHLASYLDAPVVAVFGPTDEAKYGPWSRIGFVVKKDIACRPCMQAQCRYQTLECLEKVKVEEVLGRVRQALTERRARIENAPDPPVKRILIIRTDRIGDVLLSTPVISNLRDEYPHAYIAMMVSPCAREIVEGNPYLDEVIVYDKDGMHKGMRQAIKLSRVLKEKAFDLAVVLHPANRVHLLTFFAGIPRRVGYDRKLGFLLTDRIKHTKQLGEKHESEYNLDLLRYLGIEPKDKALFMPVRKESEDYAEGTLKKEGINSDDILLAIHPAASCPSKVWPNERFAEVANALAQKHGFKILVMAGPKDTALAEKLMHSLRFPAVNLAGRTSVSQLASFLRRSAIFISNDSGPVHIASAIGVPVVSIFGRAQKGLSPLRWGPLGLKDRFLHRQAGCIECLAHNCQKEFACLKAITVQDVLQAAEEILKEAKIG
ncbi:MAG: lipopolysaccharide heptosyltransferase II [Candidatus Omnitrophica bacterium]|nr:lipopolysaccharide heptosyltransferase II [Candidatus Omnitrophota bacterium]